MNIHYVFPVQLWIGGADQLLQEAKKLLMRVFCPSHCGSCVACKNLDQEVFHATLFMKPDKSSYSISYIEETFKGAWLQRDPEKPFFFIIQQADLLSRVSAPSLLKLLEEPPLGYYFILLAQRKDLILPTIISRCMITEYTSSESYVWHQFIDMYTAPERYTLSEWNFNFDANSINEYHSLSLLDTIMKRLQEIYKKNVSCNDHQQAEIIYNRIACVEKKYTILPMPGSSKVFWRSLFLTLRSSSLIFFCTNF